MHVRRATTGDADAIARLQIASWNAVYQAELPAWFLAGQDPPARVRFWVERLADPARRALLVEDEEGLLGFCAVGPSGDADADPRRTWEIYSLHVRPAKRRAGIGRRLFDEAVASARREGAGQLTLWVVRTNTPACRFYEQRGMQPDGSTQRHQLAPGAVLAEMRYRLPLDDERHDRAV